MCKIMLMLAKGKTIRFSIMLAMTLRKLPPVNSLGSQLWGVSTGVFLFYILCVFNLL